MGVGGMERLDWISRDKIGGESGEHFAYLYGERFSDVCFVCIAELKTLCNDELCLQLTVAALCLLYKLAEVSPCSSC